MRKSWFISILSILALVATVATVEAAPKKDTKGKEKPKAKNSAKASAPAGSDVQWSLTLMGGLVAPHAEFGADPGGQGSGPQASVIVERSSGDLAVNLDLSLSDLPNQPKIDNLSSLHLVAYSLNGKYIFAPGDFFAYLLAGVGLDTQSFTLEGPGGSITYASTDPSIRTGLGFGFDLGGNSAIVFEGLFHSILSDPVSSMFPIRAGWRIGGL